MKGNIMKVWVLTTGTDHEGSDIIGIYATRETARADFLREMSRIPFELDEVSYGIDSPDWDIHGSGPISAHGGCDWVELNEHDVHAADLYMD